MEMLARKILAEVATPPVLVYPNWDVVTDEHTICPIVFISHVTIQSESHWISLDLDAGGIVGSIKCLLYLWGTKSRFFRPQGARKPRHNRRTHSSRVKR